MPVPTPSAGDLGRIAERIGYRIDADSIGEYTALVSAMLAAYDAIDSVEETPVLATRARVESRVPTAEEDPHHTWYVRTRAHGRPH
jgi:amidase